MKKLLIIICIFFPLVCHAAKVTDFTDESSPASADLLWLTVDVSTEPADRKLTLGNLLLWMATQDWTFSGAVTLPVITLADASTLTLPAAASAYEPGLFGCSSDGTCTWVDQSSLLTSVDLSSVTISGGTASTVAAWDGSQNLTSLSSQNVITTGYIDGAINVTVSTSTPVTVSGSSGYYINGSDAAKTFNLPAAAKGLAYCFANALYARAITIHPASGDYIILAGENNDSSDVVSAGASTDKICVLAIDSTYWLVTSSTGTWGND